MMARMTDAKPAAASDDGVWITTLHNAAATEVVCLVGFAGERFAVDAATTRWMAAELLLAATVSAVAHGMAAQSDLHPIDAALRVASWLGARGGLDFGDEDLFTVHLVTGSPGDPQVPGLELRRQAVTFTVPVKVALSMGTLWLEMAGEAERETRLIQAMAAAGVSRDQIVVTRKLLEPGKLEELIPGGVDGVAALDRLANQIRLDEAQAQVKIFNHDDGALSIVGSSGRSQEIPAAFGVSPLAEGEHVWVVSPMFRLSAEELVTTVDVPELSTENMVAFEGPSCLSCGTAFEPSGNEPCPGRAPQ